MMPPNYFTAHTIGEALAVAYARSLTTRKVETVVQIAGNGPVYGLLVPAMPTRDYTPTAEVRALTGAAA